MKYISVADFHDYFSAKIESLGELKEDFIQPSYFLESGDILFVRSNGNKALSGRNLFIQEVTEPITFSGFCIRARFTKSIVFPKFYAYLFKSDFFRKTLSANAGGTNINNLNQGILSSLQVPIPPLPTQRRIASILSAYDDLIENNLKRIKLLEEMAFIKYKIISTTEKVVSRNKLDDIIQTIKRKPKILNANYKSDGKFPIIDQSTDFIGGYTDEIESIYEDIPMIVFGDHTRILKFINFPFACGADGTQLVKPKSSNISISYLYFELINSNLSNYHYARHFKFLKEQIIKLPSDEVMNNYKIETDSIFNLISKLRLQNTKLREARDILLPRLMSGEIIVEAGFSRCKDGRKLTQNRIMNQKDKCR